MANVCSQSRNAILNCAMALGILFLIFTFSESASAALGSFQITEVRAISPTEVRVSWTQSAGATSYTVRYGRPKIGGTSIKGIKASPYVIKGLLPDTSYYIQVIAQSATESRYADAQGAVKTPPTSSTPLACGSLPSGASETRVRYRATGLIEGQTCESENQTRTCNNGVLSSWSGSYSYESCTVSRVRYQSATVVSGSSCVQQTQVMTCQSGSCGGFTPNTYTYQTCSVGSGGSSPLPNPGNGSYTPMVIYNFDSSRPDASPITSYWSDRTRYVRTMAASGDGSLQISFLHGASYYGFTKNLPSSVGVGETIWYRLYLYIPSTLSFAFGDTNRDGFGWNKFLVLSPINHGGPRMYVQPPSSYKANYGDSNFNSSGLFINHDGLGSNYCYMRTSGATAYSMPRDRWFALQVAWQVRSDNTAWVRVWSDTEFIGECLGAGRISSGYQIQNFGIGDYWNGGAWIGSGATSEFWVDNIVITKQTPTTVDSGGRPFIHPNDFR